MVGVLVRGSLLFCSGLPRRVRRREHRRTDPGRTGPGPVPGWRGRAGDPSPCGRGTEGDADAAEHARAARAARRTCRVDKGGAEHGLGPGPVRLSGPPWFPNFTEFKIYPQIHIPFIQFQSQQQSQSFLHILTYINGFVIYILLLNGSTIWHYIDVCCCLLIYASLILFQHFQQYKLISLNMNVFEQNGFAYFNFF